MKTNQKTEEVAAPQTKVEVHEGCGGPIFRGAAGRKCLKCNELLGNQQVGLDLTAHHAPPKQMVQAWPAQYCGDTTDRLKNVGTARGAAAVSAVGRVAS